MINTRKLKARIVELGLNQETIAKDMGINYATLNLKLNNKRRIYVDEVGKLCKILGIGTQADLHDYFGIDFLILPTSCEKDSKKKRGGA